MTAVQLNALSKKELAEQAKKYGIANFALLKKEDLIRSILKAMKKAAPIPKPAPKSVPVATAKPAAPAKPVATAKPAAAKIVSPPKPAATNGKAPLANGKHATAKPKAAKSASRDTQVEPRPEVAGRPAPPSRDLSAKASKNGVVPTKDRIVVMVRDPYWLHAYWELTHQSIQRAEAALGQDWHGAKPILRVCDVSSHDTTSTAESIIRDIDIHGGCNSWYIEVTQPPRSFRIDIGYVSRRQQFYAIARSNIISTPKAGASDNLDENWTDIDTKQADRIFAMSGGYDTTTGVNSELKQLFEERLRRPLGSPALTSFGSGAHPPGKDRKFFFALDAELIVFGRTESGSRVTLQGEPVKLRTDGTFTVRYSFPDGRQIIPAVATSADGIEERTVVLAVERNTKELEPMINDSQHDN